MVNTYYDFRNSSAFTPWVSVGLGYARIHHKATYTDTSWNKSGEVSDISALHYSGYMINNFAWSIGAGVRYDITPDIALDLSYRYLDAGNPPCLTRMQKGININQRLTFKSHDIMFGVTYNF
ncbi:outer membrane beta-barrel protein (plasmid) [Escherichia coli]|nr:outer membrane beta-barrel protein [Escherichia coli]